MSILNRLARIASEYLRRRMTTAPSFVRSRGGKPPIDAGEVRRRSRPGAPPIDAGEVRRRSSPGAPPVQGEGGGGRVPPIGNSRANDDDDEYDDIQLLGRDYSYDENDMSLLSAAMRQVSSSNVYSYAFQSETQSMGILYVTFLEHVPKDAGGSGKKGTGPGSTYAYYNFPVAKFKQFESMAESSAGGAVWDYCRVRHSIFEHQHTYRLISVEGDYVPRKVTQSGYKDRSVANVGIGKRGFRRSSLPKANFQKGGENVLARRVLPKRNFSGNGQPNRGEPNRGNPNRG